jgi:uncharacterized protein DUF4253
MLDQQDLLSVLQQHGFDTASLTHFASFEVGVSYRLTVKTVEALTSWQTLRGLVDETGYWPVIVGVYENLDDLAGRGGNPGSPREIISEGLGIGAEQALQQLAEQYASAYNETLSESAPRGAWPGPDEIPPTSSVLAGEQSEHVNIVLLPTKEGWHAPAYLNFGAWNDCPIPRVHVCMLKHWHERYGADLMSMTDTTVEVWVRLPPRDRESSWQLAWEHYVYCRETIGYDLMTNTLEDLAARLLNAPRWYFWWD